MTNNRDKTLSDDAIIKGIRSMPEAVPPKDFTARVMVGLEPRRPSAWRRFRLWLGEPKSLTVTPIRLVPAFAAALVLLAVGLTFFNDGGTVAPVAGAKVRFVLSDSGMSARSVAVIGSFNNWRAEEAAMHFDESSGVWILETSLPPGDHEYVFLVDGRRVVPDPQARMTRDDGFGNRNSIVFVNGNHEQIL